MSECGCKIEDAYRIADGKWGGKIIFCHKHRAVDLLLGAAREVVADLRPYPNSSFEIDKVDEDSSCGRLIKAVTAAEGKP